MTRKRPENQPKTTEELRTMVNDLDDSLLIKLIETFQQLSLLLEKLYNLPPAQQPPKLIASVIKASIRSPENSASFDTILNMKL